MTISTPCPLCKLTDNSKFCSEKSREYLRCLNCDFIFVPQDYHLLKFDEKIRYDTHNNDPTDERYRDFLSQLLNPLLERISNNSKGLDFGSGPGPTLSIMLEEQGHNVDLYDKFYAKNNLVFANKYDFITATEVIEHLSEPLEEIARLVGMLKDKSYLAIMTQLFSPTIDFKSWYYKNDPSHIGFFTENSLEFLAKYLKVSVHFESDRVIFLQKNI